MIAFLADNIFGSPDHMIWRIAVFWKYIHAFVNKFVIATHIYCSWIHISDYCIYILIVEYWHRKPTILFSRNILPQSLPAFTMVEHYGSTRKTQCQRTTVIVLKRVKLSNDWKNKSYSMNIQFIEFACCFNFKYNKRGGFL